MATRSAIAAKCSDGVIRSIYCHWGGSVAENGDTLYEHYTTLDKVEALIKLGSISSLYEEVTPEKGDKHSFDSPCGYAVVAYHRDRGEDYQDPDEHVDKDALVRFTGENYDAEYVYLFEDDEWWVCDTGSYPYGVHPEPWVKLSKALSGTDMTFVADDEEEV